MPTSQNTAEAAMASLSDPSALTTQQTLREIAMLKEIVETRLDAMDKAVELLQKFADKTPTTANVEQQVMALRDSHGEKFLTITTRIDCAEEMAAILKDVVDKRQSLIDDSIRHIRELITSNIATVEERTNKLAAVSEERFTRIDTQFIERDKRTDQLSLADKTAVAAALQAAKEAVGAQNTSNSIAIAKSESSTVEAIRQLQALFNTANAAMNDKINDVKSRLDKGEGGTRGGDRATDMATDQAARLTTAAQIAATSKSTVISQVIAGVGTFVAIMTAVIVAISFLATRAPTPVYMPPPANAVTR